MNISCFVTSGLLQIVLHEFSFAEVVLAEITKTLLKVLDVVDGAITVTQYLRLHEVIGLSHTIDPRIRELNHRLQALQISVQLLR